MSKSIQQVIKELSTLYPNYKFNKASNTYQAEAVIKVRCKEGVEDLAYYGGDSCGYCALGTDLGNIETYIKEAFPEYKIMDFIDGNRKGHVEFYC